MPADHYEFIRLNRPGYFTHRNLSLQPLFGTIGFEPDLGGGCIFTQFHQIFTIGTRDGNRRYHRSFVFSMIEHAHMVRTDGWKLTVFDNDRSELYDLRNDPEERHNLYGKPEHQAVQLELATAIVEHLISHRPANHHPGRNGFFG